RGPCAADPTTPAANPTTPRSLPSKFPLVTPQISSCTRASLNTSTTSAALTWITLPSRVAGGETPARDSHSPSPKRVSTNGGQPHRGAQPGAPPPPSLPPPAHRPPPPPAPPPSPGAEAPGAARRCPSHPRPPRACASPGSPSRGSAPAAGRDCPWRPESDCGS